MVREYWNPLEGWKWGELEGLLPPQTCSNLATVLLRFDDEGHDGTCWGETKMRIFTVQSAYTMGNRPCCDIGLIIKDSLL